MKHVKAGGEFEDIVVNPVKSAIYYTDSNPHLQEGLSRYPLCPQRTLCRIRQDSSADLTASNNRLYTVGDHN